MAKDASHSRPASSQLDRGVFQACHLFYLARHIEQTAPLMASGPPKLLNDDVYAASMTGQQSRSLVRVYKRMQDPRLRLPLVDRSPYHTPLGEPSPSSQRARHGASHELSSRLIRCGLLRAAGHCTQPVCGAHGESTIPIPARPTLVLTYLRCSFATSLLSADRRCPSCPSLARSSTFSIRGGYSRKATIR